MFSLFSLFNCLIITVFSILQRKSFFDSNRKCLFKFIKYVSLFSGLNGCVLANFPHFILWIFWTFLGLRIHFFGYVKLQILWHPSFAWRTTWILLFFNFRSGLHNCHSCSLGEFSHLGTPSFAYTKALR